MRAFLATLLAASLLAGCSLVKEPEVRELAGPTDGYTPTANYLKLHVKREDGTTALLDFERRDWYTAEIARRVDLKELEFVSARALPRDILSEYVVQSIAAPEGLQDLRYDDMEATPEQRARMDAEYERLLEDFLKKAPGLVGSGEEIAPGSPADTLP